MAEKTVFVIETRAYKITKEAASTAALRREIEEYDAGLAVSDYPESACRLHSSGAVVRTQIARR